MGFPSLSELLCSADQGSPGKLADLTGFHAEQNAKTPVRQSLSLEHLEEAAVLASVNEEKVSPVETLKQQVEESARQLGEDLFPGQLHGFKDGYTLSGEVESLAANKTYPEIGELQNAKAAVHAIQSQYEQTNLLYKGQKGEVKRCKDVFQSELSKLKMAKPKIYEGDIQQAESKIDRLNQEILKTKTRTSLMPLITEKRTLEISLLHFQCEQARFELDSAFQLYQSSAQQKQDRSTAIATIDTLMGKIDEIAARTHLLNENTVALLSSIDDYSRSTDQAVKDRLVNSIALLAANPYASRNEIAADHLHIKQMNPYYEAKGLDLQQANAIRCLLMRETWSTRLTDHLPALRGHLADSLHALIQKSKQLDSLSQVLGESRRKMESSSRVIDSCKLNIQSLDQTLNAQLHGLNKAKERLGGLQAARKLLDEPLKALQEHIRTTVTSEPWETFIEGFLAYARASALPENEWGGQMLELLSQHFPLLKQFPLLQDPICDDLNRRGIPIASRSVFGTLLARNGNLTREEEIALIRNGLDQMQSLYSNRAFAGNDKRILQTQWTPSIECPT
jgi:chromosome segregation ATPase